MTNDQTRGRGLLSRLRRNPSGHDIHAILAGGQAIRPGFPVEILEFDADEETIVLAYDRSRTPNPRFELLPGVRRDEKVLAMDGTHVLRIRDAADLTLASINVVATDLQAGGAAW